MVSFTKDNLKTEYVRVKDSLL